jgi:hypothetical protein
VIGHHGQYSLKSGCFFHGLKITNDDRTCLICSVRLVGVATSSLRAHLINLVLILSTDDDAADADQTSPPKQQKAAAAKDGKPPPNKPAVTQTHDRVTRGGHTGRGRGAGGNEAGGYTPPRSALADDVAFRDRGAGADRNRERTSDEPRTLHPFP